MNIYVKKANHSSTLICFFFSLLESVCLECTNEFCRISSDYRICFYIMSNDTTGTYDSIFANGNPRKQDRTCTDPCVLFDMNILYSKNWSIIEIVIVGDDRDIHSNLRIIFDCDMTSCHATEIWIDRYTISNTKVCGQIYI